MLRKNILWWYVWLWLILNFYRVRESDWSLDIAEMIVSTEWTCPNCNMTFNLTCVQKLQHMNGKRNALFVVKILLKIKFLFVECKPQQQSDSLKNDNKTTEAEQPQSSNTKLFSCLKCKKDLYLTSVDILKHRKSCK